MILKWPKWSWLSLKSDQILTYSQFIRKLQDHSCYNTVANEAFTRLFTMSYRSIGTRFRGGHATEKCIMRAPKNQDIAEGFDNGIVCLGTNEFSRHPQFSTQR